jgi:hypothetical protein
MVDEKSHGIGPEVTDPTLRSDNEKSAAIYNDNSDLSSSGAGIDYDDLPDPDVGKSDEERAKLVCSTISHISFEVLLLTPRRTGLLSGRWIAG